MDLTQNKLSKTEWNNIEIPVSDEELVILKLIVDGYKNVNFSFNKKLSLIQFIKISNTSEIEIHLYKECFEKYITDITYKRSVTLPIIDYKKIKKLKTSDTIRLQQTLKNLDKENIFEFVLLDFCKKMLLQKKQDLQDLYTLIHLKKVNIDCNKYVIEFINNSIQEIVITTKNIISNIFYNSFNYIEKNSNLLKYSDISLFSHQKQLFSIFTDTKPKLVLYTAPTACGKTLSPLGLSTQYKIIFVSVVRHIGLALAKSAISVGKKIAIAFGCETSSDIRLHYYSASDYKINKRSGGIGKVNNAIGDKVEIIICDAKSYLIAMLYMLAFNDENNIITYFDEPTITLDYEEHPLHECIHRNWAENKISKVVLSCATLPKRTEISTTINDFCLKFENAEVLSINSYECSKTISLINKEGFCVLPHILFDNYKDIIFSVEHILENKTLLRYLDLQEITVFVKYLFDNSLIDEKLFIENYFYYKNVIDTIQNITLYNIKCYYLKLLQNIDEDQWSKIHTFLKINQNRKYTILQKIKSFSDVEPKKLSKTLSLDCVKTVTEPTGILLTTTDASSLTDGPTIYLAHDVEKVSKYLIKQTNIPKELFQTIMNSITFNNQLQKKINDIDKKLEDVIGKDSEKEHIFNPEVKKLTDLINLSREQIKLISLDNSYIPNTNSHQRIWSNNIVNNAYVPTIDESIVKSIMILNVSDDMKLLLMLGIGTFITTDIHYMEIMKKLAYEQKLYLIIANSDFIYGTNYQFCHGFIGKDLLNMSFQKTLQAMGRVGRGNVQKTYSIRFRDNNLLNKIFLPNENDNIEARKFNELFTS
jgi:hypothetical protein